jgi:hypothetical protein
MVIDSITNKFPGREIVVKIDFESSVYFLEGTSEYLVIDRLQKTGKLDSLDMIFIKWHKSKPEHDTSALVQKLSDSGFTVFNFSPYHPNEGVLYAIRHISPNLVGDQSIQGTGFKGGYST